MKTKIFKVALSIVFTMFVSVGVFAQNPPAGWVANEDLVGEVDTVTLTAEMRYFVVPDPDLNATYTTNNTGIGDEASLVSRWAWAFVNAVVNTDVTVVSPGGLPLGAAYNYIDVTYVTKGTVPATDIEIRVTENNTPAYGSSCGGGNTSSAFVSVIDAPVGYFLPGALANYQLSFCVVGMATTTNPVLPVTFTTQSQQVQFIYDILDETDGSADATGVILAPAGGNLTLAALGIGDYTVTLTGITDRISRKCNANGLGNSILGDVASGPAGSDVFQFSISKTPVTGKIYHIAN